MKKQNVLLFLSLTFFSLFAVSAQTPQINKVYFAEIRGTINPGSSGYLKTAIRTAEENKAQALIVELDTPGGLVSSVKEMAQTIDMSRVPVIVYVAPAGASATSAGALLMLASHVGAMAPGSHIGAAHPVDSSGKDIEGAMGEKVLNDTVAFARGLAELRGRNQALAEAVVTKSRSLTSQEAIDRYFIEVLAQDRTELLKKLEGRKVVLRKGEEKILHTDGAEIYTVSMSLGQQMLHYLANPNIATLLMALGMLCIYVEITSPGIHVAGIVGSIALLVAFMSFQMLPIRMGGFLLLILGVVLLLIEPFVVSFGAFAIGGTISFILGVLWVIDPSESQLKISPAIWLPTALALGAGAALIAVVAARLRRISQRVLAQMGGGGVSGLLGYVGKIEALDDTQRSGKALIRGEIWNVIAHSPLQVGDVVQVEKAEGMKICVKPIEIRPGPK
ncbi:MAG: nodulation protein NfeD [Deltaproteobacteria bacterium]|nr:nodulation protein NfeD [Deltaproteobacteria bacterium]